MASQNAFKILMNIHQWMSTPALGLPNLVNSLNLHVHKQQEIGLGVLVELQREFFWPAAYFSEQLHHMPKEWPSFWEAATSDMLKEIEKFILSQLITAYVSHQFS